MRSYSEVQFDFIALTKHKQPSVVPFQRKLTGAHKRLRTYGLCWILILNSQPSIAQFWQRVTGTDIRLRTSNKFLWQHNMFVFDVLFRIPVIEFIRYCCVNCTKVSGHGDFLLDILPCSLSSLSTARLLHLSACQPSDMYCRETSNVVVIMLMTWQKSTVSIHNHAPLFYYRLWWFSIEWAT